MFELMFVVFVGGSGGLAFDFELWFADFDSDVGLLLVDFEFCCQV